MVSGMDAAHPQAPSAPHRIAFVASAPLAAWRGHARRAAVCPQPPVMSARRGSGGFARGVASAAAAVAAAAALSMGASPARALFGRGRTPAADPPVITMTDQVPNFSLPSAATDTRSRTSSPIVRVLRVAAKPAAALVVVAFAGWVVRRLVRRAQEKQLRDFQSQLQSFSSMLDLDAARLGSAVKPASDAKAAENARKIMEAGTRKYKFRTPEAEEEAERIAAKVRLDLFQKSNGADSKDSSTSASTTADTATGTSAGASGSGGAGDGLEAVAIESVTASTPYEIAIAAALKAVGIGGESAADAARPLDRARQDAGLSIEDAKLAFNTFVSRIVSVQIDKAAITLKIGAVGPDGSPLPRTTLPSEAEAAEGLKHLADLSTLMRAVSDVAQEGGLVTGLAYAGTRITSEASREELYRSYAVFCLSDEKRVKDESALQGLLDMQMLLSLSDDRAEAVNREIAKGMFQVAVSSAMADGSMTPESKQALEQLKESFGDFLENGAADNIVSEVSVMRAMYSLQQLLAEQGVSEEDVADLRKMCADLGVDIDEMMRNADQMGDALGPEAKQFVGGLRALLKDGDTTAMSNNISDLMTNTAIDAASSDATNSTKAGSALGSTGSTGSGANNSSDGAGDSSPRPSTS